VNRPQLQVLVMLATMQGPSQTGLSSAAVRRSEMIDTELAGLCKITSAPCLLYQRSCDLNFLVSQSWAMVELFHKLRVLLALSVHVQCEQRGDAEPHC
jgi:hypothetical protein